MRIFRGSIVLIALGLSALPALANWTASGVFQYQDREWDQNGFTGNVTVAIGTNPGASTLGGITTVAAVGGIATFPNLSLNRSGTGYTLSASFAGMTQPAPSSTAFNINPGPATQFAFTVSPGS